MPRQGIAPAPRRIAASDPPISPQGPAPVTGIFPAGVYLRLLETGIQAIRLSPYHADLPAAVPDTWARPPVSWHAIFPCTLSDSGKPSDPEISPLISARCAGDTTVRLMAHGVCKTVGSAFDGSNPSPATPAKSLATGSPLGSLAFGRGRSAVGSSSCAQVFAPGGGADARVQLAGVKPAVASVPVCAAYSDLGVRHVAAVRCDRV
jgi:hypothetical protein